MLHVPSDKLPIGKFDMGNTSFDTTLVYGKNFSIMTATRPGGYHSNPHVHDCEQVNIVADGELIIFVDEKGYLCKKGDYFRIPANLLHWSWNQTDAPMTLIEVHSPGLQNDPKCSEYSQDLFDDGETVEVSGKPINIFPEMDAELLAKRKIAEAPFTK